MDTAAESVVASGLTGLPVIDKPAMRDLQKRYLRGSILEAGCGRRWPFEKAAGQTLTGIDLDPAALEARRRKGDLDRSILGDLRTAQIDETFDTVYSEFVLEHVPDAERALENMVAWLKPGGSMILTFPDRNSVYGFVTRVTPFWFHVFYKRYIAGMKDAGKPGHDPYPTFYDPIIARDRFCAFARRHNLSIRHEYGFGSVPRKVSFIVKILNALSFGRLASDHVNLLYVLTK